MLGPILVSVVSLFVSVIGLLISLMLPKVTLELPFFVRVQQGKQMATPTIYVQPSFVSTSSNSRSEVIENLKLVVKSEQGKPVEFAWTDQGEWGAADPTQTESKKDGFTQYYKITSDPTPIVVTSGAAAVPVLHFQAPSNSGFEFKEGSYVLTLTANRAVADEPLEDKMKITVTEDHLKFFKSTNGTQWSYFWDAKYLDDEPQSRKAVS